VPTWAHNPSLCALVGTQSEFLCGNNPFSRPHSVLNAPNFHLSNHHHVAPGLPRVPSRGIPCGSLAKGSLLAPNGSLPWDPTPSKLILKSHGTRYNKGVVPEEDVVCVQDRQQQMVQEDAPKEEGCL
jgi:hypothetical protein